MKSLGLRSALALLEFLPFGLVLALISKPSRRGIESWVAGLIVAIVVLIGSVIIYVILSGGGTTPVSSYP